MKTKTLKFAPFVTVLLSCVFLAGCGGEGTFSPAITNTGTPPVITVTVSPASVNMFTGNTQQFSVVVTGTSNKSVTWSVSASNGGNAGTISATGFYTAPNNVFDIKKPLWEEEDTVTVTATSNAQPESTGTATINLSQNDG